MGGADLDLEDVAFAQAVRDGSIVQRPIVLELERIAGRDASRHRQVDPRHPADAVARDARCLPIVRYNFRCNNF